MKGLPRPKKQFVQNATPRSAKNRNRASRRITLFGDATYMMESDPFRPPISDPTAEKRILERDGPGKWIDWLQGRTKADSFGHHPADEAKRIAEVYRLCFEKSRREDVSIVGDFAAHYPGIFLSGTWVAEVAKQWSVTKLDETNRLLKAIADGFRRASPPAWNRQQRRGRLRAAREFRSRMGSELKSFLEELRCQDSTKEWLAEQIGVRVSDLVHRNPRLSSVAEKLRKKLLARRAYQAAILIAATIFEVRERDLQTKST